MHAIAVSLILACPWALRAVRVSARTRIVQLSTFASLIGMRQHHKALILSLKFTDGPDRSTVSHEARSWRRVRDSADFLLTIITCVPIRPPSIVFTTRKMSRVLYVWTSLSAQNGPLRLSSSWSYVWYDERAEPWYSRCATGCDRVAS